MIGHETKQIKSYDNETIEAADQLISTLTDKANSTFSEMKTQISKRKLYVMFEDILQCNAQNDHLIPKSVLPIYDSIINDAQLEIEKQIQASIILSFEDYFSKYISKSGTVINLEKEKLLQQEIEIEELMSENVAQIRNFDMLQEKYLDLTKQYLMLKSQMSVEQQADESNFSDVKVQKSFLSSSVPSTERIKELMLELDSANERVVRLQKENDKLAKESEKDVAKLASENGELRQKLQELSIRIQKLTAQQESTHEETGSTALSTGETDETQAKSEPNADISASDYANSIIARDKLLELAMLLVNQFIRLMRLETFAPSCTFNAVFEEADYEKGEQLFSFMCALLLELREVERQNCDLKISLCNNNRNEKLLETAVSKPEIIENGFEQFLQQEHADVSSLVTYPERKPLCQVTLQELLEQKQEKVPKLPLLSCRKSICEADDKKCSIQAETDGVRYQQLLEVVRSSNFKCTKHEKQVLEEFLNSISGNREYNGIETTRDYKDTSISDQLILIQSARVESNAEPQKELVSDEKSAAQEKEVILSEKDRGQSLESSNNLALPLLASHAESKITQTEAESVEAALCMDVLTESVGCETDEEVTLSVDDNMKKIKPSDQIGNEQRIKTASSEDSSFDYEGLFMLNENLMHTIEFEQEIDDKNIESSIKQIANEKAECYSETSMDRFKLLNIIKQERKIINSSKEIAEGLLESQNMDYSNVIRKYNISLSQDEIGIIQKLEQFAEPLLEDNEYYISPSNHLILFAELSKKEESELMKEALKQKVSVLVNPSKNIMQQLFKKDISDEEVDEKLPATYFEQQYISWNKEMMDEYYRQVQDEKTKEFNRQQKIYKRIFEELVQMASIDSELPHEEAGKELVDRIAQTQKELEELKQKNSLLQKPEQFGNEEPEQVSVGVQVSDYELLNYTNKRRTNSRSDSQSEYIDIQEIEKAIWKQSNELYKIECFANESAEFLPEQIKEKPDGKDYNLKSSIMSKSLSEKIPEKKLKILGMSLQ